MEESLPRGKWTGGPGDIFIRDDMRVLSTVDIDARVMLNDADGDAVLHRKLLPSTPELQIITMAVNPCDQDYFAVSLAWTGGYAVWAYSFNGDQFRKEWLLYRPDHVVDGGYVRDLSFSPSGRWYAGCSRGLGGYVFLQHFWKTDKFCRWFAGGTFRYVQGVSLDPKRRVLGVACSDGFLCVIDMVSDLAFARVLRVFPTELHELPPPRVKVCWTISGGRLALPGVTAVRVFPRDVVCVHGSGWCHPEVVLCHRSAGHIRGITVVVFSVCEKWLASSSVCGRLCVWDVGTGELTRVFRSFGDVYVMSLDLNESVSGGVHLAWKCSNGFEGRLVNPHVGRGLCILRDRRHPRHVVAYSRVLTRY